MTKPETERAERFSVQPSGSLPGIRGGLPGPGAWRSPLAPTVAERANPRLVNRHAELLERAAADARRARSLVARIERAKVADERALHLAVESGRRAPKSKVPALQEELAEAERRLRVYPEALAASTQELVASLEEDDVREALAVVRGRARRELEALPEVLAELTAALERVAAYGGEETWIAALAETRSVPPYGAAGGGTLSRALEDVRGLLPRLAEDVREELERTAAWATGGEAEVEAPRGHVTGGATELRDARTLRRAEGGESS
jgi:hypothetical protein